MAVVVGAGVGLGGEGEVVEVVLVLAHVIDVLDVVVPEQVLDKGGLVGVFGQMTIKKADLNGLTLFFMLRSLTPVMETASSTLGDW